MTDEQKERRRLYARLWREKNPEKARGYALAYKARNIDAVRVRDAACQRRRREQNPGLEKNRVRRYTKEQVEQRHRTQRLLRSKNHDRETKRQADWRAKNPEKARAQDIAWRVRNPDKRRAYSAAWKARNMDKVRDLYAARRARKKGARVGRLPRGWATVLRADPCSYCGSQGGTLDHVVALKSGGSHSADNLAGACRSCNVSKWTKPLLAWILQTWSVRSTA